MIRRAISRLLLAVADAAERVESRALYLACRVDADPSAVGFARDDLYPPSVDSSAPYTSAEFIAQFGPYYTDEEYRSVFGGDAGPNGERPKV